MRKSVRVAAVASGAILLVAANGAAAWADSDDQGTPTLTIDPTELAVGEDVTVSGDLCEGGAPEGGEYKPGGVVVFVNGEFQEALETEDDGTWSTTYEALLAGEVQIDATCDGYDGIFDYEPVQFEISPADGEDPEDDEGQDPLPELLTGEIVDITRDGCEVTLSTEASDSGDFRIEVWDDGEHIDTVKWAQDEAGSHDAVWTITQPAMEGAPGVGFVFYGEADDSSALDGVDPYEYPAEVADGCAGVGDGEDEDVTAGAAGPGGTMPATGADVSSQTTALILAGVMVSAGAALVIARRVRTSSNG